MAAPKTIRLFPFEGEQLSMSAIRSRYFPSVSNGTLYSRIVASGATTRAEYIAYMSTGKKKAALAPEKRFNRQVNACAAAIIHKKGCQYCSEMKDASRITMLGKKQICDTCRESRNAALRAPR